MSNIKSNERTFQGILLNIINVILKSEDNISFDNIIQEPNVGVGNSRFADGYLFSSIDSTKKVLFELKNTDWDATDEELVYDAMTKAFHHGEEYFVTGTPRQLAVYKTFKPNTVIQERKLKIYTISNIKENDEVLSPFYEKQITPTLNVFLKDLSDIVHGVKEVQWDSIDKYFVKKLSAYILEGSYEMMELMQEKINTDKVFKKKLIEYLKEQDIFNINLIFDGQDVHKISQLANYLLYLKIIFYSYLQRDVSSLKLKPLQIPEEKHKLNKILRERFQDVLKHDFELIFRETILDEFEYNDKYIPSLKKNVEQIGELNFKELNCDIIGAIYNSLIDNQEQHDRGQHFTNVNEVDLINAFCINEKTELVLDSGCGAGTFLVRAYQFLKHYHPKLKHEEILERLWGIEIAPFPAFLASMNLSLLDIKTIDNYPIIVREDFSKIKSTSAPKIVFLNSSHIYQVKDIDDKTKQVKMPSFDVCIGNPPYIRQELIEHKKRWVNLTESEFGIKKINQQSDLYVYYLMHTAAFLKEGGMLGYVISTSWLDVVFGTVLQKFMLDHFKIIAIIENQKVRSFETASINTIILILEKCSDIKKRNSNNVKFVRVYKDYDELIGNSNDVNRLSNLNKFIGRIKNTNKSTKEKDLSLTIRNQEKLEGESTSDSKYTNGYWGAKYLRSPEIYTNIIETAVDKLIPLSDICDVKYGIKTGANDFFYVIDDTQKAKDLSPEEFYKYFGHKKKDSKINWKANGWYYSEMTKNHYLMERRYFQSLFKSQREAVNLDVDINKLKYNVLICNESKFHLKKYNIKLLKYIEEAENPQYKYNERPTCKQRVKLDGTQDWFNLGEDIFVGDFIFPSKIGEKFRLIDNRKTKVYCDKVNYHIKVKKGYEQYSNIIFLILNSTLFRFLIDLFSRQMVVKVSDVDVLVVEKTLIIKPELLNHHKFELREILNQLKKRNQVSIYDEINKNDRQKLDNIILKLLGLNTNDLSILYNVTCNYVKERKEKSESLKTTKQKVSIDYNTSLRLVQDRFNQINTYSDIIKDLTSRTFSIPNLSPTFPKDAKAGDSNLFASYYVKFKDNNKETIIKFNNNSQILLFEFLYKSLEIKGTKILLPISPDDCIKTLNLLSNDFKKYNSQIKAMLKTIRSKAHYLSIYRDLVFNNLDKLR